MEQAVLETPRLSLRPFTLADAPDVQRLAGASEVADTTLNVPHPYENGMAEQWIGGQAELFTAGSNVAYAITLRDGGTLLGAISLGVTAQHRRAEMGYWLGVPFWNQGYMTEAAEALVGWVTASTRGACTRSRRHTSPATPRRAGSWKRSA